MINTLENLNLIFTLIFTCEFLIKLAGYGSRMFIDSWNIFDAVIVAVSVFGLILTSASDSQFGPQTTIIRSFRIVRIFFFFKSNRALKNTLMTFLMSVPAMANIGALLAIFNVIYAILGMYLFAEVKPNGLLDEHAHFRTFGTSFLTLIRNLTGENWPKLMEALSRSYSPTYQCVDNPSYEDYVANNGKLFNVLHQIL
jgi:Ion transport protein